MKNIYLIVAPSGAGKTCIVKELEKKYGLKQLMSYTTRPPRYKGEQGHIFVTDIQFNKLNDIAAYTKFCGYRYCTTAQQIEESDLYVIDPNGIRNMKQCYRGKKHIKVIYINVDMKTRYERMKKRAEAGGMTYQEAVNNALERIKNDVTEFYGYIHHTADIDFEVDNNGEDNAASAADKIYKYIQKSEREEEDK